MALSVKHQRFVEEYLKDLNASAAYVRAGYSPRGADGNSARLMVNESILEAIREATAKRAKEAELTVDEIWRGWRCIAKLDPAKVFGPNGAMLKIHEMPEDARQAIKSFKVKKRTEGRGDDAREVEVIEVQFWDKVATYASAAKAQGMFVEQHEHTGKDGGPIETTTEVTVIDVQAKILSYAEGFRRAALQNLAEKKLAEMNGHEHADNGVHTNGTGTGSGPTS